MKSRLIPIASVKSEKPILIIGATRSGTTLIENIISSYKNIECFDEPPILTVLFSNIKLIKKKIFKFLVDTYLFEERLMFSISGRNINLNKKDQTSIFKSKGKKEIMNRLIKSHRRLEILKRINKYKIAFKLVDVSNYILELTSYFKQSKIILIIRNPEKVINSILERKWYSDGQINNNQGHSGKWLFKKNTKKNLPLWLDKNSINRFLNENEATRCAMYYLSEYNNFKKLSKKRNKKDVILIDYDDVISNPLKFKKIISKRLRLKATTQTKTLVKTIKPQKTKFILNKNEINKDIYKKCINNYLYLKNKCLKFN